VVRVGSRLRSEKLEAYSLSNLRWNMRRNRDEVDRDFREITRLRFQGHKAMDRLKADVDTMGESPCNTRLGTLTEREFIIRW